MIRWFKKHFFPYRGNHHHPHILRRKSLTAALAVVVLLEFMMVFDSFILPRLGTQFAAVLPSVITLLTNDARADSNLERVEINDKLTLAAQAKAEDMAERGYFSHNSPEGVVPWHWLDEAKYKYQYAGENLAVNFTDSQKVVEAWQNSPTHNSNLISPHYTETGIGIATGVYQGREAVFVVQFFALPEKRVADTKLPSSVSKKTEATTSSSLNLTVLGAETQVEPTTYEDSPSLWSRIISSPRTYSTYALIVLAILFIMVLIIGWGRYHPKALAYGVMMVVILSGVIYANKYVVFPTLELPTDNQNAALVIFSQ